jgi:hypothetical protein
MLVILLGVAVWAAQAAEIDRLIGQLGSPRFVEREAASKALRARLGSLRDLRIRCDIGSVGTPTPWP